MSIKKKTQQRHFLNRIKKKCQSIRKISLQIPSWLFGADNAARWCAEMPNYKLLFLLGTKSALRMSLCPMKARQREKFLFVRGLNMESSAQRFFAPRVGHFLVYRHALIAGHCIS